jgi:hypothetical protein
MKIQRAWVPVEVYQGVAIQELRPRRGGNHRNVRCEHPISLPQSWLTHQTVETAKSFIDKFGGFSLNVDQRNAQAITLVNDGLANDHDRFWRMANLDKDTLQDGHALSCMLYWSYWRWDGQTWRDGL